MVAKINITLLALLLLPLGIAAQTTVELRVKQSVGSRAKLLRFSGKELEAVDSCRPTGDGVYRFVLPADAPQGLYRMVVGKASAFDFIVANEPEVKLQTVVFAVEDSLEVLLSEENRVFVRYSRLKRTSEQHLWMLGSLQRYYTPNQPFAEHLRNEKQRVEFELARKSYALSESDTSLFASTYIRLGTKPFVLGVPGECAYKAAMSKEWWNGVKLTDNRLLNTPLLIDKVWEYLENAICDDVYDKEQQDSAFVAQVDYLLGQRMSGRIRAQVVASLCRGFADTDYFGVLHYLLRHGGEAASALRTDSELMARLTLEAKLAVGCKAPDFRVKPLQGRQFKLSAGRSGYKLVVFWSIWCPHCVEMMPEMVRVYNDFRAKGLEVVAISIDDEVEQWRRFVADRQLPWANMRVDALYDNPIILGYNVDETPKMLLLDSSLTIVSRPSSPGQLRLTLERLHNAQRPR